MRKQVLLFALSFSLLITFCSFVSGHPDLVVRVVKDNISASNTFAIGVFKSRNYKNMDHKYKVISYDLYVLNYRGETKWFSEMKDSEVDFSEYEEAEVVKGDLLVINNIKLIHLKSGEEVEVSKITERYLVR